MQQRFPRPSMQDLPAQDGVPLAAAKGSAEGRNQAAPAVGPSHPDHPAQQHARTAETAASHAATPAPTMPSPATPSPATPSPAAPAPITSDPMPADAAGPLSENPAADTAAGLRAARALRAAGIATWHYAPRHRPSQGLQDATPAPLITDIAIPDHDWPLAHLLALVLPEAQAEVLSSLQLALTTGHHWRVECPVRLSDHQLRWIVLMGEVTQGGDLPTMHGVVLDVTLRKQAAYAVPPTSTNSSLNLTALEQLIQQAPIGIMLNGAASGAALLVNERARSMLGPLPAETLLEAWDTYGFLAPNGTPLRQEAFALVRALRQGQTVERMPVLYSHPDAAIGQGPRHWEVSSTPVRDTAGTLVAAVTVLIDVDDQRQAEERQRFMLALADRQRALPDAAAVKAAAAEALGRHLGACRIGYAEVEPDGEHVVLEGGWTDGTALPLSGRGRLSAYGPTLAADLREGKRVLVPDVNADPRTAAFARRYTALGMRALLIVPLMRGHRLAALLHAQFREPHLCSETEIALAQEVGERSWEAVERAVAEQALQALNQKLEQRVSERTAALTTEMRERERAEEQLRHIQKLEAVGQLTGGIAHDFNNMLTGIIGSLDLMAKRMAAGQTADLQRYASTALTAAHRAAALTQRLLAFSRRQSLQRQVVDVNAMVAGMAELIRRTIGEHIRLTVDATEGLWPARSDESQLENALLNLAINARDAMPKGGVLRIHTSSATLAADAEAEVVAGDYVAIAVTDSGFGMTPEVIARAIDPFFTTKPIGQGTGLGLSTIYGFVKQSGGHLRIESEPGEGTTITLFLPRVAPEELADRQGAEAPPDARRGAGETILVVEDDNAVRMLVLEALHALGYQTLEAADAQAALPLLSSDRSIDLLVTDVGLPGMSGPQLAALARRAHPGLRTLFVTGYAGSASIRAGELEPGMELLSKPFTMDALSARIRRMLGDRAAEATPPAPLPPAMPTGL